MKPLEFDAGQSSALIVSLHGGGGKGTDNRKQLKGWNRQLHRTAIAPITPVMFLLRRRIVYEMNFTSRRSEM